MSENLYLAFTEDDNKVLDFVCKRTGYSKTAVMRRLLMLYASGTDVKGMPVLEGKESAIAQKQLGLK